MEELIQEDSFISLSPSRQTDMIASMCAEAERLIGSARNDIDARSIIEKECERLKTACSSMIIRNAAIDYIERVYRNTRGKS